VTDADAVQAAHEALLRAVEAVAVAEHARAEADAALDRALAERGWSRMYGAFSGELYTNLSGATVPRDGLLRALEVV
jgi:hypothetical protein